MSNVTYVTALYNIYENKGNMTSERLMRDVKILLKQKFNLVFYVDDFYFNYLKNLELNKNTLLIRMPLENITIYNNIMRNEVELPPHRNMEKDTKEYMALMNSKIEFIFRSLNLCYTPYMAWIDAGINKIFTDKEKVFTTLNQLNLDKLENILIPGAYQRKCNFVELTQGIWWIYLGGFFVCPRNQVLPFFQNCLFTINKFLLQKKLAWEVNVWVEMNNIFNNSALQNIASNSALQNISSHSALQNITGRSTDQNITSNSTDQNISSHSALQNISNNIFVDGAFRNSKFFYWYEADHKDSIILNIPKHLCTEIVK